VAKIDNQVMWLGEDSRVYLASGYRPEAISTTSIDYQISLDSAPENARAFTYSQEGHQFYVLNLPSKTLVYDLTVGLWHVRTSYGQPRWRADTCELIWRKHIVGDYSSNQLYTMSLDHYYDNEKPIVRRTVSPPLYFGDRRALMDELRVDMDCGVPKTGAAVKVGLDWTDDNGNTWSDQLQATAGKAGEWEAQVSFFGLGSFFDRSYRLTFSEPVKTAISGVYGRIEILDR
jgi:hypothetical protein